MSFSSMLKKLREERNLSQRNIAEYLGITRQAVASYELAKREPDYEALKKLADYFGVSIDYLLGRSVCKDINAVIIGKNIELIKGDMTYQEFSGDLCRKTGTLISTEMLEKYAKGEKMPFIGTIKVLAKYAMIQEAFFYNHNTLNTYRKEKELYRSKIGKDVAAADSAAATLDFLDDELLQWISSEDNLRYIKFAREIQESGLPLESLKPLLDSFKSGKRT